MTEASLEILPAATVVLLRDHEQRLETLLLRRNSKLVFSAGMWVFPGGRIDEHELRGVNLETAARRAAVRETEEESGVQIKAEDLVPYSHWTTPPENKSKRYATWFFVCGHFMPQSTNSSHICLGRIAPLFALFHPRHDDDGQCH